MSNPKVSTCPVMEAVARSMFGIEQVPTKYQKRMITRAAKEAHKIYSALEKENQQLKEELDKYRWRDVNEELPEDDDKVLIWPHHKYAGESAWFHPYNEEFEGIKKDEFYYSTYDPYGDDYHPITVTHWMPMPQFKEDEK